MKCTLRFLLVVLWVVAGEVSCGTGELGPSSSAMQTPQTLASIIVSDIADTLTTGMPVACLGALRWYFFNKIPDEWHDVPEEVAFFIIETWKSQGFKDADKVALRRIDPKSVLARLVVYTQERPGALLVGEPFIQKLTKLLERKKELVHKLSGAKDAHGISSLESNIHNALVVNLEIDLESVELELDELKFICSHERVHKERHHIYKMLMVSIFSSFIVYSSFKHAGLAYDRTTEQPRMRRYLETIPRTVTEFAIGWFFEHKFECDADIYASRDPKIIRAGLRLFKRALHTHSRMYKREKKAEALEEFVLGIIFKYAQPSLKERIAYLERLLAEIELQEKYNLSGI